MKAGPALEGIIVTELGGREAVGVCGTLLAQLGATVITVEPKGQTRSRDAWRASLTAGKQSFEFNSASERDQALLRQLISSSDVVLTSSDVDMVELQVATPIPHNIICDITAFGASGPRSGDALSEFQLQAITGVMDTTGFPEGLPLPIAVPVIGYLTGGYATAAVLVALRVKRQQGMGQRIEVAMFDAAFVSLNVFLVGLRSGKLGTRTRLGNRHPTNAAWNLFDTADGRVLICAGSQGQWLRICDLMQRPDLAAKFNTAGARMLGTQEVDAEIESWTRALGTAECVEQLVTAGVAAGPIAPIDQYPREANLEFRQMIRKLYDPVSDSDYFISASPLTLRASPAVQPDRIPAPGADRADIERLINSRAPAAPKPVSSALLRRPLAGVRIIEVGQYTSAPLCARHLAHFGAEVIKIEKPGGDESRTLEPREGDRSETYCLNNADKRSIVLDLQMPSGMDVLKKLLRKAHVLIENSKPGTLAKFGLSSADLAEINPQLVHCAISGFGSESMYGDRPGFDTVIQAMSGFMTAVNPDGIPLKSGISTADLMGTEMAIVSILGALEFRDRTGRGQFIDLSMQDAACWVTSAVWNQDLKSIPRSAVVRCADGYVFSGVNEAQLLKQLNNAGLTLAALSVQTRIEVERQLLAMGLAAAPVNSVMEVSELPQTKARNIWFTMPAEGRNWPMLGSPMRLQLTPPEIAGHGPCLNQDGPAILREFGYGETQPV